MNEIPPGDSKDAVLPDNAKAAVLISVDLSKQLFTAAVAVLGLEATVAAFVLLNREPGWWFFAAIIASALALLASTYVAGKGITRARNSGYKGNWSLKAGGDHFNRQAILCTVGLVLFFVAVLFFSGHSKSASFEQKLQAAESRNAELAKEVNAIKEQLRELNARTAAPPK